MPLRGVRPQLGPPGRWWDDKHVARSLSLSPEQQHRMDDIFENSRSSLLSSYGNLQREQDRLASLSGNELKDETRVFAAIDRVTQARAELEKQSAHILMQIRRELTPEQLAALAHSQAASH